MEHEKPAWIIPVENQERIVKWALRAQNMKAGDFWRNIFAEWRYIRMVSALILGLEVPKKPEVKEDPEPKRVEEAVAIFSDEVAQPTEERQDIEDEN